jgi:hypothetical protein
VATPRSAPWRRLSHEARELICIAIASQPKVPVFFGGAQRCSRRTLLFFGPQTRTSGDSFQPWGTARRPAWQASGESPTKTAQDL